MAYTPMVLTGCRIFAGGYDLTGYSNKVEVSADIEAKEVTTFLPSTDPDYGFKKFKGGLAAAKITGGGNWEANLANGAVDDFANTALGTIVPYSVYPVDANEGSLGYFTQTLSKSYQFLGAVGDVAPWHLDEQGSWPLVRGQSLEAPGTARTTTGTGTAVQLGAVPAGKQIYAALHVLSIAGTATPTITVTVESNVDNTFASPTTRISFAAATAVGGQILRTPGPITDTWWRARWTISGTTPSFLFVVSAGISI